MVNNKLDSLFVNKIQEKLPVLAPLKKNYKAENNPQINIKDSLIQKYKLTKLINPLELFHTNDKNPNVESGINNISDKTTQANLPHSLNLLSPKQLFLTSASKRVPVFGNIENNSLITGEGASAKNISAVKQIPGTQWLGKLASNGNREVAIIIPKGIDLNKPVEVVYHFHGREGTISKVLADGKNYGLKEQLLEKAADKNIIIVVPQGPPPIIDAKGKTQYIEHTWMSGKHNEDMQQFQQDTVNLIKNRMAPGIQIGSITVEGHSAGGNPIKNSAVEGKLSADKVVLLDSTYGDWGTKAYENYIKKNPSVKFNVVYIPGSQTQGDALKLKGKPGVTMYPSKVDHSSVPKNFFNI